jgi:hypothetical protein
MNRLDVIKHSARRKKIRKELRSDFLLAADNLNPKIIANRWTQRQVLKITRKASGARNLAGRFAKDNITWIMSGALAGLLVVSSKPILKLRHKLHRKD